MFLRCLQNRVGNRACAVFILLCFKLRAYGLLAWATTKFIKITNGPGNRGTVLGLSPGRFRGELDALEAVGYRIVSIHPDWVARISTLLFRLPIKPDVVFLKRTTPEVEAGFERLNRHLLPMLLALGRRIHLDIALSAATHYAFDYLWGQALNQIDVPYIVVHRECNKASKYQQEYWQDYWKQMPDYEAHSIIVHNEPCKEIFVNSGIVAKQNCHVLGAMRMDDLNARLKAEEQKTPDVPTLLFFSFFPGVCLPNSHMWRPERFGFPNLFEQTHRAFFRFLHRNPDVAGILKLKWMGGNHEWENALEACFAAEGLTKEDIPNLSITAEGGVLDLVQKSSAVIAFGSTTMLEAGVSGKAVIVPCFAEVALPGLEEKVLYFDKLDVFNCARSEDDFEALMASGVAGELRVNKGGVRDIFETWVAPLDGRVVERHVNYYDSIIASKRHKAGSHNAVV